MPGPSNPKKKRKTQVNKSQQKKGNGSASMSKTISSSMSVKDMEGDSEDIMKKGGRKGSSWRQSIGSDSTSSESGPETPRSPSLGHPVYDEKTPEYSQLAPSKIVDELEQFVDRISFDSDIRLVSECTTTSCSETESGEPLYTPGKHDHILLRKPYIHDSGNGPRVEDVREFLDSRFFVQPPAFDDPLRAEFAQEEVLQMIKTVLPDEMALILWYNKSRASSRICPACRRLYRLGELLPDPIETTSGEDSYSPPPLPQDTMHPQLLREQELSGFCTSICFILASVAQCDPLAIKAAWGHTEDEIDDKSWAQLSKALDIKTGNLKELSMILRMTRLPDLGLAQLCFPDVYPDAGEVQDRGEAEEAES